MEVESMKKLKSAVEKCIDELAKKSDLTPAETKAALDGMKLREMLCEEIEDCEMQDDMMRSEHGYSGRRYSRRSMYDGPRDAIGRYAGNREGIGWYEPNYYGENESYRRGYSRHSIGDRAVEKLEEMMDTAGSEYEREQLKQFIRMIRAAAD